MVLTHQTNRAGLRAFLSLRLDLAAHFASGILDLAPCRRECILDRDHDVLVFGRIAMSLADEDTNPFEIFTENDMEWLFSNRFSALLHSDRD